MTALQPAEGIRLLTDDAAAEHAGVHVEIIWTWVKRGFITPVDTPVGPRYALHEIRAVLAGDVHPRPRRLTSAYRAAEILGVGSGSLRKYVKAGRLHIHGQGHYDLAELEALREAMATPRTD